MVTDIKSLTPIVFVHNNNTFRISITLTGSDNRQLAFRGFNWYCYQKSQ